MDIQPAINHEISSRRSFPSVVHVRNGFGASSAEPEPSDATFTGHASELWKRNDLDANVAIGNCADRPAS
jgi:hypothetical protein